MPACTRRSIGSSIRSAARASSPISRLGCWSSHPSSRQDFGFGGEYGEGALLVRGRPVAYYNTVSASFGFQLGAQVRSVIIMFMTPQALDQFRKTAGWKIGVDGSVAIITVGVGGSIDTNKITSPVVGFILDPKGLMYNLTLEGSKISRISR